MNPIFAIDFYKAGHVAQYAPGVTQVWSNWTPRSSYVEGCTHVNHVGLQYFIKSFLIEKFNRYFFSQPLPEIAVEHKAVMKATLGIPDANTAHIEQLHRAGYLPLSIYSVPEGDATPLRVPSMVITNTEPWAFWLPNYLETILSNMLWRASTSATTARAFRDIFTVAALRAGETDLSFIDWQGHDFSMRGMSSIEDAILSGLGHLTQFSGTDTLPAILAAREYYGAALTCGGSVPATEHSVMSSYGDASEFECFERLLMEVYPTGILSVVSDTWDLWKVLTKYVPLLRDKLLARDGKLVIRPDSGDPVKIMCGDPKSLNPDVQRGALRLLAQAMGTKNRMINKAGLIYGDGITRERATAILDRTIDEIGLSPYNIVFGLGSYTYAYVTRDTYGFAMKATAIKRNGVIQAIFKDPVTDSGTKKSLRGIPVVYWKNSEDPAEQGYYVRESLDPSDLDRCAFKKVFENGTLLVDEKWDDVRARARGTRC